MKPAVDHATVLRRIRDLQTVVIHPQDQDGEELVEQLHRIGCRVQIAWPELDQLPLDTGLILMAVRPETLRVAYTWLGQPTTPPVIPVVTYESPTTIEAVLRLNAYGTIASPVRAFGLLTVIAVTLSQHEKRQAHEHYIRRLEQKSAHQRLLHQAKQLVMRTRGVSEDEAYGFLRDQAMSRRITIEDIARNVMEAHKLLGL